MLPPPAETSADVASRVAEARTIQIQRYKDHGLAQITSNAAAPASLIETVARPDATGMKLLHDASERLHLSARGFHRILKLARTIADLDAAVAVGHVHLAEALSYRINTFAQRQAA
jgi:magnesium chelatase family protein